MQEHHDTQLSDKSWYYSHQQDIRGPLNQRELIRLFETRELAMATLVWTKGMEQWRKAEDQSCFSDILDVPPPLPPELTRLDNNTAAPPPLPKRQTPPTLPKDTATSVIPKFMRDGAPLEEVSVGGVISFINETNLDFDPHPWHRYWARMFDCSVVYVLCILVPLVLLLMPLGLFIVSVWPDIPQVLINLVDVCILLPLYLMLIMVVEASLLHFFGTTPGKKLFRIRILQPSGHKLTFSQAFARTWRVFFKGCGLCIPPIALCTMICSFSYLIKHGYTSWDPPATTRCLIEKKSILHTVLAIGLVLLMGPMFNLILRLIPTAGP